MDVLPVTFAVLKFCGAWAEDEHAACALRALHFLYRCVVAIFIYHFTISELIELTYSLDDIASFTETLFQFISYVGLCVKFGNFIARRKEFLRLLGLLRTGVCQPRDSAERDIIAKYNDKVRRCTLAYFSICHFTGGLIAVSPLFGSKDTQHPLPLRAYQPYSTSSDLVYSAAYLQQALILLYGIALNVSFDTLVYGLNLLVCGQMELLSYRFNKALENADFGRNEKLAIHRHALVRDCIRHHLLLHEIVRRMESFFMRTIVAIFFVSLITLCASIFQISEHSVLSLGFMTLLVYLVSMLFQIFFYCWYGNELELKSKSVADAVYFSNWTSATLRERRSLLIVMAISQKGLILSYHGVMPVAVHTFMWVIKTSYSAFNLLQRMSD